MTRPASRSSYFRFTGICFHLVTVRRCPVIDLHPGWLTFLTPLVFYQLAFELIPQCTLHCILNASIRTLSLSYLRLRKHLCIQTAPTHTSQPLLFRS
jgi:hypothetical protein